MIFPFLGVNGGGKDSAEKKVTKSHVFREVEPLGVRLPNKKHSIKE